MPRAEPSSPLWIGASDSLFPSFSTSGLSEPIWITPPGASQRPLAPASAGPRRRPEPSTGPP
eukprot:7789149-Lingulodinium_polyedra.AAC.1